VADTQTLIADALRKEGIYSPELLAYAMGTVQHETAGTMQPIREYGGPAQAKKYGYSGGENFYGRGFIQLTHDYNYKDIGQRIGMGDALYKNPDLALDPEISARILAAFFKDRGVADKVASGDMVGARRPVNPDNKGNLIAGYANKYLAQYKGQNAQQAPTQAKSGIMDKVLNIFTPKKASAMSSNLGNQYTPSNTGSSYIVKPGDTLSKIAQTYLGSASKYSQLSGYKSGNPNLIYPGEVIRW
jgi:LysM repeat protein